MLPQSKYFPVKLWAINFSLLCINDCIASVIWISPPSISKAPSNKAVIGRYILPKKIFSRLINQKPGKGGEIHITDAIQSLIQSNEKFIAHNFTGKYLDCGSMDGYIKSTLEIAKSWNFVW